MSELHSKEFKLDEKIQEIINEGLRYIEKYADLPFENKADLLVKYLQEKGVHVERDRTFGDVIYTTPDGWGVTILFNEQARRVKGDIVW